MSTLAVRGRTTRIFMPRLVALVAACMPALVACTDDAAPGELDLAAQEEADFAGGKADASWDVAPTLHVGRRQFDRAAAGGRRVYPVWIAGSASTPVPLAIGATAVDGASVRVAVLGPLQGGQRAVLGAAGYTAPTGGVELELSVKTSGEHLLVVASHDLSSESFFEVTTSSDASPDEVDVLSSPKAGALVATGTQIVQAELGRVLANRTFDVELELWASPPMRPWDATKIATSVASGTQINVIVPPTVQAGDDVRLVVRKAGGPVLDAGVPARYAPEASAFVRTDAVLYGDLASVQVSGVVGFFEGHATLELRNETRGGVIDADAAVVAMPGHVGNGLNAFDATFAPELTLPGGGLNPDLPHNGVVLSVGFLDGNAAFRSLGCFEYCNDLSGFETCTGGPRACPTATAP